MPLRGEGSCGGGGLKAQSVKNLPAMQEIWVRFLGQEDPLEKESLAQTHRGRPQTTSTGLYAGPRRGIASPVAVRRGEGAQRKRCEETHETPRSSRDEGLIFLHGLETNHESSLQTEEQAGLRCGSLSLLQGVFLTQESNQGLLHYRRIFYQLSRSERAHV